MLAITSVKRVVLLTVLINILTTFTVMTLFSSGMLVANAANPPVACSLANQLFGQKFKSGNYTGTLTSDGINSKGVETLAHITMALQGTPPPSQHKPGKITGVSNFTAKATSKDPLGFVSLKGDSNLLDANPSPLADFTLHVVNDDGSNSATIDFTRGAFFGSGANLGIAGSFTITGGSDDNDKGSWSIK